VRIAGIDVIDPRPVAGGDICRAYRGRTAAGQEVFAKTLDAAPVGLFSAEAHGLDQLRVAGGPPVPQVHAVAEDGLVLEWVEPGPSTSEAAATFGRALATLHGHGGRSFGADQPGYVGPVKVDNAPLEDWPTFYAQCRLLPAVDLAAGRGALGAADLDAVHAVVARLPELAGPAVPPARVHGDLWAGNLLWGADGQVWLVDAAAAHDGHPETDLAMLLLFGAALMNEILAGYREVREPVPGWSARVGLHQIHPLLIHAALFGGGYGRRAGAAAREQLGRS
jgi:fructosamine-3-kinase